MSMVIAVGEVLRIADELVQTSVTDRAYAEREARLGRTAGAAVMDAIGIERQRIGKQLRDVIERELA